MTSDPRHPTPDMRPRSTPWRAIVFWVPAVLAGAAGLVLAHGFHTPPIEDAGERARLLMVAGLGLFVLSRVLMLLPLRGLGTRLGRWWVDYVLIVAAIAWWIIQPEQEGFILRAGTVYVLIVGMVALFRGGIHALADGLPRRSVGSAIRRLSGIVLLLVIAGGAALTLPVCRRTPNAVEADHMLAGYHLRVDLVNSTLTAASALTGTALTVQDIGYHYNRIGQCIILLLMLVGGLGILSIGVIVGLQFRRLLGWSSIDDDTSGLGMRRSVLLICLLALFIQALGAVGLYRMWDPARDLNFGTALQEPALLEPLVERTGWDQHYDEARLFASVFHSVSAFTGCGLTMVRDDYIPYRQLPGPLLAVMPLMFLGSLGGPVILELLRRMTRRSDIGLEAVSKDTWVTLGGSLVILLLGAAALYGIESTRQFQQRYPREATPGRLLLNDTAPATKPDTVSETKTHAPATQPATRDTDEPAIRPVQRARAERLSTMPEADRVRAALFLAETARAGGARSARIDETSLSPASHLTLIGLMLVGGGVGGTAGGLRIVIVWLLIAAIFKAGRPRPRDNYKPPEVDYARALAMATAVAAAMFLLIGAVTVILVYHETGEPLACLFEAVSACGNAGLSLGVTPELSLTGRVTLILAMILGRLVPLAILMRSIGAPPLPPGKTPLRANIPEDDAPIPQKFT